MAEASDRTGALYQSLVDSGCGKSLIRQFMAVAEEGKEAEALPLLKRYRRSLLDCYHAQQKKLDCLDYLVYQIEKQANKTQA